MDIANTSKTWDWLDNLTAEIAVNGARAERARYRDTLEACEIIERLGLWRVLSFYLHGWWWCADFEQEAKDVRRSTTAP